MVGNFWVGENSFDFSYVPKCLECGLELRDIDGIWKCTKCKQLHQYILVPAEDPSHGYIQTLIKISGKVIGCGEMKLG